MRRNVVELDGDSRVSDYIGGDRRITNDKSHTGSRGPAARRRVRYRERGLGAAVWHSGSVIDVGVAVADRTASA